MFILDISNTPCGQPIGSSRTRWGAAPDSRKGWLVVDLEKGQRIGSVKIWETDRP